MGGDGGVIASNRRYMRGAGTADTTGDTSTGTAASAVDVKRNQRREALELMTTCALSKTKLRPGDSIVACRFGRLYLKEAAVQALLLRRNKTGETTTTTTTKVEEEALAHVKKLSELYPVRGNTSISSNDIDSTIVWTCPITAKTLTGSVPPAILLVPGNVETTNVLSEFAFKQLSEQDMQTEYGPIDRRIRLAPNPEELAEVQAQLKRERNEKKSKKDKKHKDSGGKRKRSEASSSEEKKEDSSKSVYSSKPITSLGSGIRSRVDSALESNQVLSSLFSDKKQDRPVSSEKNRKDNLFAR
jgi:hypothetical protein